MVCCCLPSSWAQRQPGCSSPNVTRAQGTGSCTQGFSLLPDPQRSGVLEVSWAQDVVGVCCQGASFRSWNHWSWKRALTFVQSNHQSILSWDGWDANSLPGWGALSIFAFKQDFADHCCLQRVERCFSGLRLGWNQYFPIHSLISPLSWCFKEHRAQWHLQIKTTQFRMYCH